MSEAVATNPDNIQKQLGEGKKDANVEHTERIDPNEDIQTTESTRLDFMKEDQVNDFIKTKTKIAPTTEEPKGAFPSADEIKNAEDKKGEDIKPEDLEMVAEFIITLIDTVIPNAFRIWSKDTSDKAYSLPENKKKMLIKQLTMILIKKQSKFRIEFIFIIGLIMFYIPAFMKARETRKENKKLALEHENNLVNHEVVVKQQPEDKIPAYVIKEDNNAGETVYTEIKREEIIPPVIKPKQHSIGKFPKHRKPGGQRKA